MPLRSSRFGGGVAWWDPLSLNSKQTTFVLSLTFSPDGPPHFIVLSLYLLTVHLILYYRVYRIGCVDTAAGILDLLNGIKSSKKKKSGILISCQLPVLIIFHSAKLDEELVHFLRCTLESDSIFSSHQKMRQKINYLQTIRCLFYYSLSFSINIYINFILHTSDGFYTTNSTHL